MGNLYNLILDYDGVCLHKFKVKLLSDAHFKLIQQKLFIVILHN